MDSEPLPNSLQNPKKLPPGVHAAFQVLLAGLELDGSHRANWSNNSKLGKDLFHCHIRKGRPTDVAVWKLEDKTIKIIKATYVGTHEKAPY